MVNTRSSHPVQPPSIPGASNNLELMDFLKSMAESIEVLKKQNKDLNTRLTAAEARNSQKEKECTERSRKEKQDRIHQGKWIVNPNHQDNESIVQGRSRTIPNEE